MDRSPQRRTLVSVIVPTLDEVDNVDPLISAIFSESSNLDLEVLVADGGSTDGTIERVKAWEGKASVRLVRGDGTRGLAGDILVAAANAAGEIVVVMDADLSHPAQRIGDLVRPIDDNTKDMVVGSRYVPGGATPDWPWPRRLLSQLGGSLAWPLTELRDPMSGFFAVRRDRLLAVDPAAAGLKIGLEIIALGGDSLRLAEVPIVFRDRVRGRSKIGLGQMISYGRRLMVLAGGAVSIGNAARFASVGLVGLVVDLVIFQAMFAAGFALVAAHVASFAVATVSNYVLNSRWAFAPETGLSKTTDWRQYSRFLTVCLLAFSLRAGVLALAVGFLGLPPQIAILVGVGAASVVNYLGSAFFVFPSVNPNIPLNIRWRIAAIGVLAYVLLLRLVFMGQVDLIPEEAYYWNYAQHLDFGYLDHPPMVAWLIWLGTSLFGDTEFGVRSGAFVAWLTTAYFSFQFARNLNGKSVAFVSVLVVATLPFFFAIGLLMMPDAPLTAAWAGALHFLERALMGEQRRAWWGVGICVGLGLLSKYTMALLGPATLFFLLFDARARRWILRPEPYLALALAVVIFSPVIAWNAWQDWASFAFQSSRRLRDSFEFSLPALVLTAAVLLTPLGLISAIVALLSTSSLKPTSAAAPQSARRSLFVAVYTVVPLFVFVAFSLFHSIKLDWTGPIWLALVPAIAGTMLAGSGKTYRADALMRRLWIPTITTILVFYGLGLHYLVLGIPGTGYIAQLQSLPLAWHEFGREAGLIEREVDSETGKKALLVGMDTYFVASELAFYDRPVHDGVQYSVGRGAFGQESLMYGYWFSPRAMLGENMILFGMKRDQLQESWIDGRFSILGEIKEQDFFKAGKRAGQFFYRIGYDLQPRPDDRTASNSTDRPISRGAGGAAATTTPLSPLPPAAFISANERPFSSDAKIRQMPSIQ